MSTKRTTPPVFAKIQDTGLDLSSCISFKITDQDVPGPTLIVETPLEIHHFCFLERAEADRVLRSIYSRLNAAGHDTPLIS
jgi:hypothetical protein